MATKLLNVHEAAAYLGEHWQTTQKRLRSGQIKGTKLSEGKTAPWKVTQAALDHFILKNTRS